MGWCWRGCAPSWWRAVVGDAEDGDGLLAAVGTHRPHVVLADVQMPGMDGLAALGVLRARPDARPSAVLTTFDLDEHVTGALRFGVQGFLIKDAEPAVLVRAVLDLAAGGAVSIPGSPPACCRGSPPSPCARAAWAWRKPRSRWVSRTGCRQPCWRRAGLI